MSLGRGIGTWNRAGFKCLMLSISISNTPGKPEPFGLKGESNPKQQFLGNPMLVIRFLRVGGGSANLP